MTIYYVVCKDCGVKVEFERKPQGDNIATTFSATWKMDIRCGRCHKLNRYELGDINNRQEWATHL